MALRCQAFDWASTPLGPVNRWPQSLRTIAQVVIASSFPSIVLWGPELIQIYNDGYRDIIGVKHPEALGMPTFECWPEARHITEPLYARVLAGETIPLQDTMFPLSRNGPDAPPEDVYVSLSYIPVLDEHGDVAGILIKLFEVTQQVVARQLKVESDRLYRELQVERSHLEEVNAQLEAQQLELELVNQQLQENAAALEVQTKAIDRTSADLRASEARVRDVLEQAPIAVAVMNGPDHVYTIASAHYTAFVGGRTLIGLPFREAIPEFEGQGILEIIDEVYRTGRPYGFTERPVRLAWPGSEGLTERIFNINYHPLRDGRGQVYAIASTAVDVTEQVHARQSIDVARTDAEQAQLVAERARVEAVAANQAKSAFLAMMSHEIRTPINAIQGYTQLIGMGLGGTVTTVQQEYLTRLETSAQHLLGIVNDVLDLAKVDAGEMNVLREASLAGEAVAAALDLTRPQAAFRRVHLLDVGPCTGERQMKSQRRAICRPWYMSAILIASGRFCSTYCPTRSNLRNLVGRSPYPAVRYRQHRSPHSCMAMARGRSSVSKTRESGSPAINMLRCSSRFIRSNTVIHERKAALALVSRLAVGSHGSWVGISCSNSPARLDRHLRYGCPRPI